MCTDICGYIHNVSPIQTSHGNVPYFTATLEQGADYHPVTINGDQHAKINIIQVNRYSHNWYSLGIPMLPCTQIHLALQGSLDSMDPIVPQ